MCEIQTEEIKGVISDVIANQDWLKDTCRLVADPQIYKGTDSQGFSYAILNIILYCIGYCMSICNKFSKKGLMVQVRFIYGRSLWSINLALALTVGNEVFSYCIHVIFVHI